MSLLGKGLGAALLPFKNPMMTGTAIGAGIGYSGHMDPTNAVEGAAKGALFGAGIAGGIGGLIKYGPGMARKGLSGAFNTEGLKRAHNAREGIGSYASSTILGKTVVPGPDGIKGWEPTTIMGQIPVPGGPGGIQGWTPSQTGHLPVVPNIPSSYTTGPFPRLPFSQRPYMEELMKSPVMVAAGGTAAGVGQAASFIEKHPGLALGAVAAGAVATAASAVIPPEMAPDSPTLQGLEVNTSYSQQAIAAEQMMMGAVAPMGMVGTANQMMGPMQRQFQASTTGLVQGLHRGRH